MWILLALLLSDEKYYCASMKIFPGGGPHGDGGVGDRLHRVRVRGADGVHRHPPQDEAAEAVQLPPEEGHLRRHGPHLPSPLPLPLPHLQPALLDRRPLHQVRHVSAFIIWFIICYPRKVDVLSKLLATSVG